MTTRPRVTRRSVLRGATAGGMVSVTLPLLEAFLDDHGEALANRDELPSRFGVWFFGNGVRLSSWVPSAGVGWEPPPDGELAPLVPHRDYVSVVSGLSVKTPRHPHHSGMAAMCSGGRHLQLGEVRETIASTFKYPSVDQVAAEHFMAEHPTPYRSLEAAITRYRWNDEGTTFQHLSHNGSLGGETNVNPSEESPRAFFDRLFGREVPDPAVDEVRASVLSAVGDQIRDLQGRLGASDRRRLEQHLDSIADLERRLEAPRVACAAPTPPGDFPDQEGREQIVEKNRVMSDIMALALACDLTRAFSIRFSTCGSQAVMWPAGAEDGQHHMTHTEPSPWDLQHASVTFTMSQLATFLERLRQTPEGAGNLLDRISLLVCTEHAEGWTHAQDDMPVLICGKGGGRLRGNVHARDVGGNTSKALLTALRGAGVPLASFGHEEGYVTAGVSALEA